VTRQLTTNEMASLNRALAKRTNGRVRVGPAAVSVAQGIALWNASAAFVTEPSCLPARGTRRARSTISDDTRFRGRPGVRRALNTGAVLAASMSLGACATFGGNVKGDFACRAPDGVCAPTSTIDDAALALIAGAGAVTKAGPFTPEPARQRPIQITSSEPVRSGEKVLRIVFPAHIDDEGRYRESTAIHAVVERGAWMAVATAPSAPVRTSNAALGEASSRWADSSASDNHSLGDLASAAPEVRFPDPIAAIDAQNASVEKTALAATPDKSVVVPAAAKPARFSRSAAHVAIAPAVLATRPEPRALPTTTAAHALPAKAIAAPGAQDPMAKIRAQVAERLRSTTPAAAIVHPAPSLAASASASIATDSVLAPMKPLNAPSLFPVSDVNR
jgi:conjugal transfer pilus assembly protein TraV